MMGFGYEDFFHVNYKKNVFPSIFELIFKYRLFDFRKTEMHEYWMILQRIDSEMQNRPDKRLYLF